ncbi:RNA polymerase sigma-70 factor [Mucilaginibacter mali]|uniref:RNA polymerase sigma-70 factor n=1 Tax=Mucilaginibacter mali TaxID=2740462 RepID=A0A7D4UFJ6_9SPHI|nr:RNA polymerase sigma-70 factor [Mucilaginibacter mali]QKJ32859.1 RNA polymerase sigma-70 factor [Mucilaginibacter mali]
MAIPTTPTDQQLVAQLREGNAAAYTQLFDRFQPTLYVYARKITKDKDEAADIVQEVFLYLWDKRDSIEFDHNILAYLYSAVRYKFFNLLDKKKVRLDYADSLKKYMQEGSPETDNLLREREMLRLIEEQISLLPPKLKLIYELSRKANMSTAHIAELLDVSEKTVQNQVSLAVKQLKMKLGALQLTGLFLSAEALAELMKKL